MNEFRIFLFIYFPPFAGFPFIHIIKSFLHTHFVWMNCVCASAAVCLFNYYNIKLVFLLYFCANLPLLYIQILYFTYFTHLISSHLISYVYINTFHLKKQNNDSRKKERKIMNEWLRWCNLIDLNSFFFLLFHLNYFFL